MTDEQVVGLAIKDPDLFLELMQRYEYKLLAYINRLIKVSNSEAEDILQEVFIKSYQNLQGFDQSLKFSAWIYRITYNHTISYYRKNKKHNQVLNNEDSQQLIINVADDLNLPEKLSQKLENKLLHELVAKLEPKYRDVLVLKFLEEKDYNEISDILKKPVGTVGTLINRAKKQLKQSIIDNNLTA